MVTSTINGRTHPEGTHPGHLGDPVFAGQVARASILVASIAIPGGGVALLVRTAAGRLIVYVAGLGQFVANPDDPLNAIGVVGSSGRIAIKTGQGALRPLEVARYKETTAAGRGVVGDRLTGDHIPSNAAVKEFWENLLGRRLTPAEAKHVQNNGTTVVVTEELHKLSRTYGGRNTASQISGDASDLFRAAIRDTMTLRENARAQGVPESVIDTIMVEIHLMNKKAGLY